MINYDDFLTLVSDPIFKGWNESLAALIAKKITHSNDGNLPRFIKALEQLPDLSSQFKALNDKAITVGQRSEISDVQQQQLEQALKAFMPWRKGPFELFGVHIDSEWRSDLKWERLISQIRPLKYRKVLDVGCPNGYHSWRMKGEGAELVVGVDPSILAVAQFFVMQKYLQDPSVTVLPIISEEIQPNLELFDTVFSMGVLYHRRSPFDHLFELRGALCEGGELILETLVIDGELGATLVPHGRYAKMNNIWFLPSVPTLMHWLEKVGFVEVRCIDVTATTDEEQRLTNWKAGQSLADFLDPNDPSKTVEGHPAPLRATIVAKKPDDGRRLPRYA